MTNPYDELGAFPSTRMSIVAAAQAGDRSQLERLLERYLPPLRQHLRFQHRLSLEQANEVLQAFITDKILAGNLLERFDATRGRLRNLLRRSLDNYRLDLLRREPHHAALPDVGEDAHDVFSVEWARQLTLAAVDRTRTECLSKGQEGAWRVFEGRLVRPACTGEPPIPFEQLQQDWGFADVRQVYFALTMIKRKLDRFLREELLEHMTGDEVESEINELQQLMGEVAGEVSGALREYLEHCDSAGEGFERVGPAGLARLLPAASGSAERVGVTLESLVALRVRDLEEVDQLLDPEDPVRDERLEQLLSRPMRHEAALNHCKDYFKRCSLDESATTASFYRCLYFAAIAVVTPAERSAWTGLGREERASGFRWARATLPPKTPPSLHDVLMMAEEEERAEAS